MSEVKLIKVLSQDDNMRINRWFLKYYPSLPLSRLQKLLRTKQIKVNGKKAEINLKLQKNDEIRIPPINEDPIKKEDKKISVKDEARMKEMVIYKDEKILVLNKPNGLAVQGGTNTIRHIDAMLDALKFENDEKPKLVHRIDKDTSGVLLLARNRKTAELLISSFKKHSLPKTYLALVKGCPKEKSGTINLPIDDKKAITVYKVIDNVGKKFALLECNPLTGRKHQIRIHLQSIDTPIVGDDKYNFDKIKMDNISSKMHLHAYKMDLSAICSKKLIVTAKLPEFFKQDIETLGMKSDVKSA